MNQNTDIGNVMDAPGGLTVTRAGQKMTLTQGQPLQWGDEIQNTSATPAQVLLPARGKMQHDSVLKLQPGAAARIQEASSPEGIEESRTEVLALSESGVELFVSDVEDGEVAGLVGAVGAGGFGLGGLGLLAAGLGGLALASGSDSGGDGATDAGANGGGGTGLPGGDDGGTGLPGGDGGGGGPPVGGGGGGGTADPNTTRTGAAGLLDDTGSGVAQTQLEPLTQVTDPLADGLNQVADGLAAQSGNDPSGVVNILANTLGETQPGQNGSGTGATAGLESLTDGLTDGTDPTPLEPLITPVADAVAGDAGQMSGISAALGDVGAQIAADSSPLSPITADTLAPVVGTGDGTTTAAAEDTSLLSAASTTPLSSAAGLDTVAGTPVVPGV